MISMIPGPCWPGSSSSKTPVAASASETVSLPSASSGRSCHIGHKVTVAASTAGGKTVP